MKVPTDADFEIQVQESGVNVTFIPTQSHYSYNFVRDPEDIAHCGALSLGHERHAGPTGDTDQYRSDEVQAWAHRLALAAVSTNHSGHAA